MFLAVVILKFGINITRYFLARRLREKYFKSFTKDGKPFEEYIPQAKKLFEDAGIQDDFVPVVQPMGYRKVASR